MGLTKKYCDCAIYSIKFYKNTREINGVLNTKMHLLLNVLFYFLCQFVCSTFHYDNFFNFESLLLCEPSNKSDSHSFVTTNTPPKNILMNKNDRRPSTDEVHK